jgi:dTDP-4-amino-4,6-dideoxygalactose transaminase
MSTVLREAGVKSVPLLDLKAQYRPLEREIMDAIAAVCRDQHFILGKNVTQLEEAVAKYSNVEHAIGVSSGTDALLVALMVLEIGAGDEVITTPYTFFATGGCVARVGARPVFCDIDPATYNLSPEAVRTFIERHCKVQDGRLVNKETGGHIKALMPVHLFGQISGMTELMAIASEYKLRVIEDAAQAIGSESAEGKRAGSIGDIGCFSFFPSKNLGAFGDGGMCVTRDAELAERLRIYRVHGGKPKYYHRVIGGNFRLDELQAAVLVIKLKHLDAWTAGRRANADRYDQLFAAAGLTQVVRPYRVPGARHIFNQYIIRVPRREQLQAAMKEAQIGNEVYYPVPLHAQDCFAYLRHKPQDFPLSAQAAAETLAIPVYPELTLDQQRYVVDCIARFFAKA